MEVSLGRIAGAQAEEWGEEERQFAEQQWRKIYSGTPDPMQRSWRA